MLELNKWLSSLFLEAGSNTVTAAPFCAYKNFYTSKKKKKDFNKKSPFKNGEPLLVSYISRQLSNIYPWRDFFLQRL